MPRLLDYLSPAYAWLALLDPSLPRALFVAMVFFSVWLIRQLAPNQWEAFANLIHVKSDDTAWWQNELRAAWQMLPAAIIGTLYGLLGTGADPWPTLKAMLLALLAPVVHRIAARYKGQVGAVTKATAPLLVCLLLLPSGCASWKPVARTTNDVARVLCGEFFGEKQGLSVEEAAKKFCETRDDLEPWIDAVLAAKREAAPKAQALHP